MIARITLTAAFITLAACSHQPANTILSTDISKLESLPPVSSSKFDLSLSLKDGDKTIISETKSGRLGTPIRFTQQRELFYPSSYNLPQIDKGGTFPVTPSTPRKFKSVHTGWTGEFVARVSGGLVILEGEITHTSTEFSKGIYGEASDRIVAPASFHFVTMIENNEYMPIISKTTYPLNIRAVPNKDYVVSLPDGTKLQLQLQTKK